MGRVLRAKHVCIAFLSTFFRNRDYGPLSEPVNTGRALLGTLAWDWKVRGL